MRRWWAIARATALEILSEPLSLLVLLTALALMTLAPAFHYHQFGEPTRMARDAGFSALFTFGAFFAASGALRAVRREIESGTLEMALAHAVSRRAFFLSKAIGAAFAYLVFLFVGFAAMLLVVEGARVGGMIAAKSGDLARVYGPFLAAALAVALVPYLVAAALNRFVRCRFVFSAFMTSLVLAAAALGFIAWFDAGLLWHYLPAVVPQTAVALTFLAAAAALAVRFRAGGALAATALVVAATLPALGNFYLADSLSRGGAVAWTYALECVVAVVPAIAGFLILGARWMEKDAIR